MQIGPYHTEEELARGGMGVVYRARGPAGATVALKVLLELPDPEALERFRREVSLQREIDHPNLVKVIDANLAPPRPYAAFELVEGGTLEQHVEREGPLRWERAVELIAQLATAVAAVHQRGLLHRDIKPANVLLGHAGAKLADFGLIKDLDRETLTESGMTLGTPAYLAPEQIGSQKERWGPATDVYGLAGTLYYALCAKPPFEGASILQILKAVAADSPTSLRAQGCDVPAWLEEVCLRGLAKQGSERYRDAIRFRAALLHPAAQSPTGRSYARLAALAVALAVGGVVSVWAAWRSVQAPPRPAAEAVASAPDAPRLSDTEREVAALIAAAEQAQPGVGLELAERAVALGPNVASAHLQLGRHLGGRHKFDRALAAVDQALKLEPAWLEAQVARANLLVGLGRVEEGLAQCEAVLARQPDMPRGLLAKALALTSLGRREEGIATLDRLLELDPRHAVGLELRGSLKQLLSRHEEALVDFKRAIEAAPSERVKDLEPLLAKSKAALASGGVGEVANLIGSATAHFQTGRFEQGLGELERALELDPLAKRAHVKRGEGLASLQRFEEAHASYRRALEIDPEFVDAYVSRAKAFIAQEHVRSAQADLRRALELDPKNAAAYLAQGILRAVNGRPGQALDDFAKVQELEPEGHLGFLWGGIALHGLGRFHEAAGQVRRALELAPAGSQDPIRQRLVRTEAALDPALTSVEALIKRAEARLRRGEEFEALGVLDRLLELDRSSREGYLKRAQLAEQLKRPRDAEADYARLVELDSSDPMAYYARGTFLMRQGRLDEAVADLGRVLELKPRSARVHIERASILVHQGRLEGALQDYTRALELDPSQASAFAGRGDVLRRGGRYAEAIGDFDRALRLDPRLSMAYVTRAQSKRALGHYADALADYDVALRMGIPANQVRRVEDERAKCLAQLEGR